MAVLGKTLLKQTSRTLIRFSLWATFILTGTIPAAAEYFSDHGRVGNGWQFDASIDAGGIVHLIADQYYQFDLSGEQLAAESQAQDFQQYNLAFPPALSIDPAGNVHTLVRGPGYIIDGVDINYRVRNSAGDWRTDTRNYRVDEPQTRNYIVGLAAISDTEIYAHYGRATDGVRGQLLFWKLNDQAADKLGSWTGVWRVDLDTRMRTQDGKIFFASANSFTSNDVYFSIANAGETLLEDLKNNVRSHQAGSGRRGGPDISIDKTGAAHLTYGADQAVYYNQYNSDGSLVYTDDQRILSELGSWHLNFGIAAVAASDDGSKILVLGLKSDGNNLARNSQMILTYSMDSGRTWSKQIETGQYTHGGEGRMRPRLFAYQDKFVIIYFDAIKNGFNMASIPMDDLPRMHLKSIMSTINLLTIE